MKKNENENQIYKNTKQRISFLDVFFTQIQGENDMYELLCNA